MAGEMEDEEEANHQKGRQEARVTLHGRTEWNGRTQNPALLLRLLQAVGLFFYSLSVCPPLSSYQYQSKAFLMEVHSIPHTGSKETLLDSFLHVWVWGFGLVVNDMK
jgi:hypothetical protein